MTTFTARMTTAIETLREKLAAHIAEYAAKGHDGESLAIEYTVFTRCNTVLCYLDERAAR